jgi:hypothetical protein
METKQIESVDVVSPRPDKGATLLEVAVATLMMTIGLLACALTLVASMTSMHLSQRKLIAKQKVREALESVFTARNTQNITYNQIRNVSDPTVFNPPVAGIFVDGWQAVRGAGADGIVNTADDAGQPVESVVLAGEDGLIGTTDDLTRTLSDYERRITITNVLMSPSNNPDPDIRQITVDVRFQVHGRWHTVNFTSRVSKFS